MNRDIFLFEKMNEIYDKKISFMIDSLDNQLRINMLEAQYKVITESGTKEDFKYLYMEAQEETKEKKKNILTSISTWIATIGVRIRDFFKTKKIEKTIENLPPESKIDESYKKQFSLFKKFHDWLLKPIQLIKQKKFMALTVDLMKKGVLIVNAALGVVYTNQIVTMKKDEIKNGANWILKVFKTDCDNLSKFIKNASNDNNVPSKILKECGNLVSKISSGALKWCTKIASAYIKASDKIIEKQTNVALKLGKKLGDNYGQALKDSAEHQLAVHEIGKKYRDKNGILDISKTKDVVREISDLYKDTLYPDHN